MPGPNRDPLRDFAIQIAKPQVSELEDVLEEPSSSEPIGLDLPANITWADADSDPIADIKAMFQLLRDTQGYHPTEIILSPKAAHEYEWWLRVNNIFPNMDAWVAPRLTRVIRWWKRVRRDLRWKYEAWDERRHPEKYF